MTKLLLLSLLVVFVYIFNIAEGNLFSDQFVVSNNMEFLRTSF